MLRHLSTRKPKTWTCPLWRRQGGSPIFADFAAKTGAVPVNGYSPGFPELLAGFCGKIGAGWRLLGGSRIETSLMDALGPKLLTRLLDEHGAALVLYAQQWCDTPEDVVQEAFLRLMRQSEPPENVVGWLYRVVRNGAISASRAAGRRRRREAAVAHRREPWFKPSEADRLDAAQVTRALAELPVEHREIVVARLWGGLPFAEIARLTGTSTSTAHRHYEAALAALRERLGVTCPKTNRTET